MVVTVTIEVSIMSQFCSVQSLSRIQLFATPWTVACQAPLPMGFSRQQYWSGLPCPSPRDLLNPGIEPRSLALHADFLPSEPPGKPICLCVCIHTHIFLKWLLLPRICWSSREEKHHVQVKRNPSKMVGTERGHQRAHRQK